MSNLYCPVGIVLNKDLIVIYWGCLPISNVHVVVFDDEDVFDTNDGHALVLVDMVNYIGNIIFSIAFAVTVLVILNKS